MAFLSMVAAIPGCGGLRKDTTGKETVETFGDGTWVIIKTDSGPNLPPKMHLYCPELDQTLLRDLVDWRLEGDWVFAVGEDGGFALLNVWTNDRSKYKTIEEAPVWFQPAFRKLRTK